MPVERAEARQTKSPRQLRWYHIMAAVISIAFCLEIGFFLMMFPWTESWERNFFSHMVPTWHRYWDNSYVRGGVSGLGLLNVYIGISEIFRLRRFVRK
jgi:hypothetical protein